MADERGWSTARSGNRGTAHRNFSLIYRTRERKSAGVGGGRDYAADYGDRQTDRIVSCLAGKRKGERKRCRGARERESARESARALGSINPVAFDVKYGFKVAFGRSFAVRSFLVSRGRRKRGGRSKEKRRNGSLPARYGSNGAVSFDYNKSRRK